MGPFKNLNVRLTATVAPYQAALARASATTRTFGQDVGRVATQGDKTTKSLGKASMLFGGGLLAAVGLATRANMGFEKSISGVAAVAPEAAGRMDELRTAALRAGADTVFSASQAADAEAELVKAGVSVSDVLGGALMGSLDLAAAGQLALADAATIAAQAMNIFDLAGSDVGHIADVLAAGANKSAADVDQLGQALRQGGLMASQTGLELEETVGVLAAFADNAMIGSDAGTSLKTMLQRLTPQSAEARDVMRELGFSAFDLNGNFVGMEEVARRLQASTAGLTQEQRNLALGTMFGSDAIRGANVLLKVGADGVRDYTEAVNDEGAAARMAATQLDNLSGDLEQLKGSVETALIKQGSGANEVLRGMVQHTTNLVNAFGSLPPGVQQFATLAALGSGALLVTLGAVGTLAPKVRELKTALDAAGTSGQFLSRNLGTIAKGGLGAVAILAAVANMLAKAEGHAEALSTQLQAGVKTNDVESLRTALERTNQELERTPKIGGAVDQAWKGLNNAGELIGSTFGLMEPKIMNDAKAVQRLSADSEELASKLNYIEMNMAEVANATGLTGDEVTQLANDVGVDLAGSAEEVVPALIDAWDAARAGADPLAVAGDASADLEGKLDETKEAAAELERQIADMAEGMAQFVDPVETYKSMMESLEEKERERATAVAESTKDAEDTWEDHVKVVTGSIDKLIAELEENIAAQAAWADNLRTIAARGAADVAAELATKGPEMAGAAQLLVDASDKEFDKAAGLWRESTELGGEEAAAGLRGELEAMEAIGKDATRKTREQIAAELNMTVEDVQRLANEMGVDLHDMAWDMKGFDAEIDRQRALHVDTAGAEAGISRVRGGLDGIQSKNVTLTVAMNAIGNAVSAVFGHRAGGVDYTAASGQVIAHVARGTRVKYAEPSTGGEAYVPRLGDPIRGKKILDVAAGWYGYGLVPMQHGGVIGHELGMRVPTRHAAAYGSGLDARQLERLIGTAVREAARATKPVEVVAAPGEDPLHTAREVSRSLG